MSLSAIPAHLVDSESNAQVLNSHLLLLATILLHQCYQYRALPITVSILCELHCVLRVVCEGRIIAASSSCTLLICPATVHDDRVPALDYIK